MKTKTYWHTKVNVKDYEFDAIELDNNTDLIQLHQNIILFNKSKNKEEKIKLAELFPDKLFPTCRFCGKKIINVNFEIYHKKNTYSIQLIKPKVFCREIDGNKYYLSCCEDCLLDHFKNNPPKSQKYYFMKANKYGQYSFGYSDEEYRKLCSMTVGVTKESMINKWGNEIGEQKWNEYCNRQAETNTYEYKKEKFGWNKQDFDVFNKGRAVTLKNLTKKYGDEEGLELFNDYCKKQKITKSFDYMKEKYGEIRANEINKSKALTINNFIKKYGEEIGVKKYDEITNHNPAFYSKVSQKLFNELDTYFNGYKTYYATKNNEYGIMLPDKTYVKLDYYIYELKTCIEFNGTKFHADPRFFKKTDYPNPFNKSISAKEIWDNDNNRINMLAKLGIKTIVVWEFDYNKKSFNIEELIKKINP